MNTLKDILDVAQEVGSRQVVFGTNEDFIREFHQKLWLIGMSIKTDRFGSNPSEGLTSVMSIPLDTKLEEDTQGLFDELREWLKTQ